jgi:hypothetical protein
LCAIDVYATEGARVRCVQFSARGNKLEFGFGFGRKRYESIVMDLREDVGLRLYLGQMVCSNDQEHAEEIGVRVISQIVDYFMNSQAVNICITSRLQGTVTKSQPEYGLLTIFVDPDQLKLSTSIPIFLYDLED